MRSCVCKYQVRLHILLPELARKLQNLTTLNELFNKTLLWLENYGSSDEITAWLIIVSDFPEVTDRFRG